MADGLAHRCCPERHHWNTTTVSAFYHRSHYVWLGESTGKFNDVIFPPLITGTLIRPHVVGASPFLVGVEAMLLLNDAINVVIRTSGVRVCHTTKQEIWKVIVNFDL